MRRALNIDYQTQQALGPVLTELLERLFGPGFPRHGETHLRGGRDPLPEGLPGTLSATTPNSIGTGPAFLQGHTHALDLESLRVDLNGRVVAANHGPRHRPDGNDPAPGWVTTGSDPAGDVGWDVDPDSVGIGTSSGYAGGGEALLTAGSGGYVGQLWMSSDHGAAVAVSGETAEGRLILAPLGASVVDFRELADGGSGYHRLRLRVDRDAGAYLESDGTAADTLPLTLRTGTIDAVVVQSDSLGLPVDTEHPAALTTRDGAMWYRSDTEDLWYLKAGVPTRVGEYDHDHDPHDLLNVADQHHTGWADGAAPTATVTFDPARNDPDHVTDGDWSTSSTPADVRPDGTERVRWTFSGPTYVGTLRYLYQAVIGSPVMTHLDYQDQVIADTGSIYDSGTVRMTIPEFQRRGLQEVTVDATVSWVELVMYPVANFNDENLPSEECGVRLFEAELSTGAAGDAVPDMLLASDIGHGKWVHPTELLSKSAITAITLDGRTTEQLITEVVDTVLADVAHNDLTGLQGGAADDYQHLTTAQVSALHAPVTVTDTASIDLTLTGQALSASVNYAGPGSASTAARSDHTHSGVYEPVLGNPAVDGYSLTSTAAGVRSWVSRVPTSRTITAGSGLTGGGDLSANRSIAVNWSGTGTAETVSRSDHYHSSLAASDGSPSAALSVDATGKVGIGTTGPTEPLQVVGNAAVTGLLKLGNTPTTVSNAAGKLLTSALVADADLAMGGYVIAGLSDSTDTSSAATRGYVDSRASGITWLASVLDWDLSSPPDSPTAGDRYIVKPTGTGAWAGHDNEVAQWTGAAWSFTDPATNNALLVADENLTYIWNGSAWVRLGGVTDHGTLLGLADDDHAQYHTDARALTWLSGRSTSDLPEGTRLYYTDARARAALSGASPITYNTTSGVIGVTTGTTAGTVAAGNHTHNGVYEPVIAAGTTGQFFRGDKTWSNVLGSASSALGSYTPTLSLAGSTTSTSAAQIELRGYRVAADAGLLGRLSWHNALSTTVEKRVAQIDGYANGDVEAGSLRFLASDAAGTMTETLRLTPLITDVFGLLRVSGSMPATGAVYGAYLTPTLTPSADGLGAGVSVVQTVGSGATNVGDAIGLYVPGSSWTKGTTGTVARAYGLYVSPPTLATTNYAIYTSGGTSSLAGTLKLPSLSDGLLKVTSGTVGVAVAGTDYQAAGSYVPTSRTLTAGSGLTGGGDLSADRSFAVSWGGTGSAATVARSDHYHSSLAASDGSPASALSVDATGNVGIGTTSPGYDLDLGGATSTTSRGLRIAAKQDGSGTANLRMGTPTRDWDLIVNAAPYLLHWDYAGTDAPLSNILTLSKSGQVTATYGLTIANLNGVLKAASGVVSGSAAASDLSGWPAGVSMTEVGYLDGVTSAIQGQINTKVTNDRQVIAGTGLTGGGILGSDVTLSADFGSTAGKVAEGNHTHSGTYEPANANIQAHIASTSNPHSVTKTQVGLGNVLNVAQEPALGNPAGNGYVLTSTTGGVRSWVSLPATHDPVTVSDTASVDLTLTGQALSAAVKPAGVDHGSLAGLSDDDHTQYHTDGRALTWLGTRSTSDLPEGSRLYYTDARARAALSGTAPITYNSGTGAIGVTTGTTAGTVATGNHTHTGTYEPVLGNPAGDGYVLSSTATGVRSWVAPTGSSHDPVTVSDTASVNLTLTGQALTASVLYAGTGTASTAARSDHTHLESSLYATDGSGPFVSVDADHDVNLSGETFVALTTGATAFTVQNYGTGYGAYVSTSGSASALYATNAGTGTGIHGNSTDAYGVYGDTASATYPGVYAANSGTGPALTAHSTSGDHANFGGGKLVLSNAGNLTVTGTIRSNSSFNINGTAGVAGPTTITIPKLTAGGANGSLTISGGIITAATNPT